jgi:hypothetical protein
MSTRQEKGIQTKQKNTTNAYKSHDRAIRLAHKTVRFSLTIRNNEYNYHYRPSCQSSVLESKTKYVNKLTSNVTTSTAPSSSSTQP